MLSTKTFNYMACLSGNNMLYNILNQSICMPSKESTLKQKLLL